MVVDIVVNTIDERHLILPLFIATAVGEERHLTPFQTCHLFWRQSTAASCSQPKMLWLTGCHDEGRLLALHKTDVGIGPLTQQMLAKEALIQLPIRR